jgi:cysteinyl-tRNA synthetase
MKYGGYYPPGAEEIAARRDVLRSEGKYEEADKLREEIAARFSVEVLDTKFGYALQWKGMNRVRRIV